jgi:hypothetical protein
VASVRATHAPRAQPMIFRTVVRTFMIVSTSCVSARVAAQRRAAYGPIVALQPGASTGGEGELWGSWRMGGSFTRVPGAFEGISERLPLPPSSCRQKGDASQRRRGFRAQTPKLHPRDRKDLDPLRCMCHRQCAWLEQVTGSDVEEALRLGSAGQRPRMLDARQDDDGNHAISEQGPLARPAAERSNDVLHSAAEACGGDSGIEGEWKRSPWCTPRASLSCPDARWAR